MRIINTKSYDEMSAVAADLMAAEVRLNPACTLGLATGGSPVGMYERLGAMCAAGTLDFKEVTTINLDEYIGLAPGHAQSYRRFMEENLFSRINIARENTNLPDGLAADLAAECARYDALIAAKGGVDMQLLGMGGNGHIGFNEPSDAFIPGTHAVDLDENTIDANARFFERREDVPRRAITMGMYAIMNARRVLLIINTPDKAAMLDAALNGPVTPRVPASLLQLRPNVTVVVNTGK